MTSPQQIHIEVAYALKKKQVLLQISLPFGATVESAIHRSGILTQFPEIDLARNKIGVFSKLVKLDTELRDKDRVEIYRALIADPKEIRRQRAAEGKSMIKGGSDAVSQNQLK